MSKNPNKKNLFFSLVILFVLSPGNFSSYGQCGVYLRHTSTQLFPYSKVFLDSSADMTGDGKPDLVASEGLGSFTRTRLFVIPNNGNGTFGSPTIINPPSQIPFDSRYEPFLIGDVNNDSHNDIITFFDTPSRGILAYINNGNGTSFTPQTLVAEGQMGHPIDFADLNNDGFGDYLGFTNGGDFRYSLGNGNGTFGAPITLATNDGIAYRGDFNNDGKVDFVNSKHLYLNQGNLTFTVIDVSAIFGTGSNANVAEVRDFNGDGRSDVVTGLPSNNPNPGFAILTSTGMSFTRTDYEVSTNQTWQGILNFGNFSGNSSPDIVYSPFNLNKKAVYTNDGAGNFTRQDYDHRFYNPNFLFKAFADFDGDGKTDVVQATSRTDNGHVMLSDITSFTFQKNVCDRPGQPRIVDFDGKGDTSFSFWNPSTGDWSSTTNTYGYGGELTQTQIINWGLGSMGDIPTQGDFDGDGITDRAVFRDSTGYWYIRRSSDLVWIQFPFGTSGDKPVAADFDGDTITDIAVWRPSDGNWYFWYMGTQQFASVHFGSNGDKPVPADFDGDLKTDVAVYRPSTGFWYYLKSSNGDLAYVQWGITTDKPIPADYDGDGKADITVYRDSDHGLYIRRSYNSSLTFYQYGISGDILQVGDYDGDFVADLGIYRPSTRAWWTTDTVFFPAAVFGADNVIPTSSILRVE
jgi:hypothetical protein